MSRFGELNDKNTYAAHIFYFLVYIRSVSVFVETQVFDFAMDVLSKRTKSARGGGPDIADSQPTVRKYKKSKSRRKNSSEKQTAAEEESEIDSVLHDSEPPRKKDEDISQDDSSNVTSLTPPAFIRKENYSSIQPGAISVRGQIQRHRSHQLGDDDITMDQTTVLQRDHESGMISDLTTNSVPIIATVVNDSVSQPSTLDTVPQIKCCTLFRDLRIKLIILVIILIAGGLIAACVLVFLRPNPQAETAPRATESPTPSPTGWTAEFFLKSILEPNEAWEQPSSPQSQALKYLEYTSVDQELQIPQAYAAQVLRFGILKENGVDISTLEGESQRYLKGQSSNLFNECSWSIMSCSNQGRITSIKMSYTDYSFTLPTELSLLSDLNDINFSANKGYGPLPSILASLNQLKDFILDDNQFTGTIPTQIATMDKIVTFSFSNNRFEGTIPSEFGLTTTLHEFDADGNAMTGTLPSEIFANPEFCYLYLSRNRLRGSLPSELGRYSILKNIHLDGNSFTGNIPTEVGNLLDLGELLLQDNELSGTIPSELGKLSASLQNIMLANNKLSGTIPVQLTELSRLWGLMLGNNELSGTLHTEFGRFRYMTGMDLGQNNLEGTIPTELGYLVEMGK
jgi:Leucine-rich repeat (LRR) protein